VRRMNEVRDVGNLLETIARVLIRCFFMGVALILIWLGFLVFAGEFTYNIHSWFIPISRQQFDCIHYAAMAITKLCIFLFFLLPYIAIRIVLKKKTIT
jgi:MFS superfamily sulfate permease-like transporter